MPLLDDGFTAIWYRVYHIFYSFLPSYIINFIWMFGAMGGIFISLLCALQIVHASFLWVLSVPRLLRNYRAATPVSNPPEINMLAYVEFS